jgi:LuxR family maltose regulon positive regulatory protein
LILEQLLATKFHIPPARPNLVQRQRLLQRLDEGLHCKLTLISALAGFGKTTLVNEWVSTTLSAATKENSSEAKIAWLSLDENDNNLRRFLIYFTTGLKRIPGMSPELGDEALEMLQSPLTLAGGWRSPISLPPTVDHSSRETQPTFAAYR